MRDLGTLGGPDAAAAGDLSLNEHGQVAGFSFTDDIVNPVSGVPTLNPFRWKNGRMLDLGGLGGVFGLAFTINNRGQVVGFSDIAGDQEAHAFRWNRAKMEDLGTLGGSFAGGGWINDAGEVVGASFTEGDASLRGFIWRQGVMTSLGTVDGDSCSDAYVINAKSQVVGPSFDCDGEGESHAYLWQRGVMTDLNAFVPPDSHLQLISARFINDRGEIIADGFLPNGHERAVLLIPCDKEHGERKGCRDASKSGSNLGSAIRGGGKPSQRSLAPERLAILRQRFVQGHGSLGRWPRK